MENEWAQFDTEIPQTLGKRLRKIRRHMDLTQGEFAALFDIGRSSYTYYELDRNEPSLDTIRKMCRVLHVSADFLLGIDKQDDNK